ncbi:beta-lactamase/transpeptidase-like protein [Mycena filopes]|nr:beta-lactamase/transpeptidase-like protein [Mycena filopes]
MSKRPRHPLDRPRRNLRLLTCRPPLPTLLAANPPRPDAQELKDAAASLHESLSRRTAFPDIDSLSIAVVTPAANESSVERRGSVNRDSIYRIASITKVFTVLHTLILRERGILNWDDPVSKFLPTFTTPSYGWSEYLNGTESTPNDSPITLRQLASHLAGIGRDYPPYDNKSTMNDTLEALLEAVEKYPLVAPQYTFPIYSNAAMNLLGHCNLVADISATRKEKNYAELIHDGIFKPLGLKHSFYEVPDDLAAQIAIPSSVSDPTAAFSPAYYPAGGQYSSLADLITLTRSLLSPEANGVISPYVVREWLRPLHAWSDGAQEVGAPWEIEKIGREARLYAKAGNVPGYHSQMVLNPQWSYGVIVLVTGTYADTATLAREAISHFQPAFENLLLTQVLLAYTGLWIGDDSVALVTIEHDALYLQTLMVGEQDVLGLLQRNPSGESRAVALWSTGRPHEFRLGIGRSELNDVPAAGCEPYWLSFDYPHARGAPLDLIMWDGSELVYPSAGVRLRRE